MQPLNSAQLRQFSFYAILIFLGIFLFLQLSAFIPSLLGAVTLYVLLDKPFDYLVARKKWNKPLAVLFLMLASFVIILLPVTLFVNILYNKIGFAVQHSNEVTAGLQHFIGTIENNYHITIINEKNIQNISLTIAQTLPKLLGATFNSLLIIVIMYFILYFLLLYNRQIETWLYTNAPLRKENVTLLGSETRKLVFSNALGLPITAFLQGIIGAIGYYLLGVPDVPFWFIATCLSAMVPMIGSALAYLSLAVLFFAEGHTTKGILITVYGVAIMAVADNVFRIYIQRKIGNIHPLVTIFGVIVGVKLFGFIGLIFGPILISLFILLVRIYLDEFGSAGK